MALNELHKHGDSLPYDVAPAVNSGDLVVFASGLVGVAETDAEVRENGVEKATIRVKGVFGFPFTGALVAGTAIYASTTASAGRGTVGTLSTTASGNARVGTVYLTKGTGAGTAWVNLNR